MPNVQRAFHLSERFISKQSYAKFAKIKGLSKYSILRRHIFKNSLIPLSSKFGYIIGFFLAGNYLIEYIFQIDGLGMLIYNSFLSRDYPVILIFTLLISLIIITGNILNDVILQIISPKIDLNSEG